MRVFIPSTSLLVHSAAGARCFSRVGFVGLGNMGGHMARNLLKKGHKLTVFDVNESAVLSLTKAGANSVSNAAVVAKDAEVVVSMLPSNQQVLDVYSGKDGIFCSANRGVLLIDSSTIDPFVSQTLAKEADKSGAKFIDCPVSGGVNAAKDGTLTFMVGGTRENFELAKPLLESMGSRIVHCGDVGTGQAAKLCNNMLLAISMIGTAEAFNLGQKLGLDANVLADIVNSSSGRCWSSELYNPVPGILDNVPSSKNYEGGFGTALMAKDLGLAQSAATKVEATIPLGSLAHQIFRAIIAQGHAKKDFSFVYQFLKGQKECPERSVTIAREWPERSMRLAGRFQVAMFHRHMAGMFKEGSYVRTEATFHGNPHGTFLQASGNGVCCETWEYFDVDSYFLWAK